MRRMSTLAGATLLFATIARGQTGDLKVTAVSLRGTSDPALSRHLSVKVGDVFDEEAVRSSVLLLSATDVFEEVRAERQSDGVSGVHVIFTVRETPRLGEIRVLASSMAGTDVAAESRLSTGIRRASGLRAGEAFRDKSLEAASARMTDWLRDNAYPEASVSLDVQPSASVDPKASVTRDVVVRLKDVRQETLVSARIDDWPNALPRPAMPATPGEPLTRENLDRWKASLTEVLFKAGYYRAQIRTESVRGDLVFFVNPGTPFDVDLAVLNEKERKRAIERFENEGLSQDAIEETMSLIETHYIALGHRDVEVDFQESRKGDRTQGTFAVREGQAWRIATVEYFRDGVLTPHYGAFPSGVPWIDTEIEAEKVRIRDELVRLGYASAIVSHEESGEPVSARLAFEIVPGSLSVIRSVAIEGAPGPTERGRGQAIELLSRERQPFRAADVARDRTALLTSLRDDGYIDARVEPVTDFSDDRATVAVSFRVSPGPRVRVGRILVVGLEDTRESVILRESRLKEGDYLSYQKLLDTQSSLSTTGLFTNVSVRELSSEADVRNLIIEVTEGPRTTLVPGLGWAESEKLRASLEVTRLNISGLGRTGSLFVRGSTRGSRALFSFTEPYAFGRRQAVNLQVYRDDDRSRLAFHSLRYGFETQTIFPFRYANVVARYTFQRTRTRNVLQDCAEVNRALCDGAVSGPSIGFVHDTRNDALDPRRGALYSVETLLSSKRLRGDSFIKGTAFAARYEEIRAGTVIAGSVRVGLARAFGGTVELPLPERFFAGGATVMRGFRLDELGPGEIKDDRFVPEGGNALVAAALEARIDITKSVGVQLFAEMGNVFDRVQQIRMGSLRETAGFGITYKSPFGPLRLDWGFKLDRRSGEDPHQLHLGIGYAF